MKANLELVENIAKNLQDENWQEAYDDMGLIDHPAPLLRKIIQCFVVNDGEAYPDSAEDERWLKAIAPTIAGEYACGNI